MWETVEHTAAHVSLQWSASVGMCMTPPYCIATCLVAALGTSLPNSLCVFVLHSQKLCHSIDAELLFLRLACELAEPPLYTATAVPNA